MSIEQEVEILRNIPMFAKIEPAKLKLMAFASERITFKPGQALFRQGTPGMPMWTRMRQRVSTS